MDGDQPRDDLEMGTIRGMVKRMLTIIGIVTILRDSYCPMDGDRPSEGDSPRDCDHPMGGYCPRDSDY